MSAPLRVLAATCLLLILPLAVDACMCRGFGGVVGTPEYARGVLREFPVAFIGRVVAIEIVPDPTPTPTPGPTPTPTAAPSRGHAIGSAIESLFPPEHWLVTLQVEHAFQGNIPATKRIVIRSSPKDPCVSLHFEAGRRYLVFLEGGDLPVVGACNPTVDATYGHELLPLIWREAPPKQ
ncbi:MAG TPA: hypothetical protein VFD71_21800 [Planctomycetota bacterium]|nr:hypothetical protein [Planctomycetota bacterium]